jgi:hypothetical protein
VPSLEASLPAHIVPASRAVPLPAEEEEEDRLPEEEDWALLGAPLPLRSAVTKEEDLEETLAWEQKAAE